MNDDGFNYKGYQVPSNSIQEGKNTSFVFDMRSSSKKKINENDVFNFLLNKNNGVGFMSGLFDESLSITFIDSIGQSILGLKGDCEYKSKSLNLSNLLATKENKTIVTKKLSNPDGVVWSLKLKNSLNKIMMFRIFNVLVEEDNDQKRWFISFRKFVDQELDGLTTGYNLNGFISQIEMLKQQGLDLKKYAILFINIKGFKAINDIHGYEEGNRILVHVYNYLHSCWLKPLLVARKESDKFLLFVPDEYLNLDELPSLLKIPFETLNGQKQIIETICGIYYIRDGDISIRLMIDCAKLAKQYIVDRFICPYAVFNEDMRKSYIDYSHAIIGFEDALKNKEFVVYYQPIMDCKTLKLASAEALVRWNTKFDGMIPPGVFVPALEEKGIIIKLDRYVYRIVADFILKRSKNNLPIFPISVNFSRMDFFDKERIDLLIEKLTSDKLTRENIHIEITETSHEIIKNAQEDFIKRINAFGGMVYLDDFGVSNTSLELLTTYDFDVLKLDMEIINKMMSNYKVELLIQSLIQTIHAMGLKVIAEGIETKEQLDKIKKMGCDYAQGYYFSKPLDENAFVEFVNNHL